MSKRNPKDANVSPPPMRVTQQMFNFDPPLSVQGVPDGQARPLESLLDEAAPVPPDGTAPAADGSGGGDDDSHGGATTHPFRPGGNGPLSRLFDTNFLMYASYTICDRAIPTVEDGLKPVQRRILHTLSKMDDGSFIKVANVVGATMAYHPHGDASIGGALVVLANKRYLIEGQGNFGSIYTEAEAAAPRYIECRLTKLAREEIFNPKTTEYIPSYDGRSKEPVLLPSKLPLLLMHGADGIAVGLSTRIMPHNFIELLRAEIAILRKEPFQVYPDFLTGGLLDVSEYNDGCGRLRVRARMKVEGNSIVITEIPFGETTETVTKSIEDAIRRKKLNIRQINDHTAGTVEIELVLPKDEAAKAAKTIEALYAFTKCEVSISCNMVVLENNRPCERTVSQILRSNVEQLVDLLRREHEIRLDELAAEHHTKTLVQIFIEERIYKRIEQCTEAEQIPLEIRKGFEPFKDRLVREISDDDITMLLDIKIRRISLYDMRKNRDEIEAILKEKARVQAELSNIRLTARRYLERLVKDYEFCDKFVEDEEPKAGEEASAAQKRRGKGATADAGDSAKRKPKKRKLRRVTVEQYPRLTEITTFGSTDVRQLTANELTIRYDREGGYVGFGLKTGDEMFKCSSLDRILLIWKDGRYRVVQPPEKLFVDKDCLMLIDVFDRERVYTMVYTDKAYGCAYLKRFKVGGVIMNRDYSCIHAEGAVLAICSGTPPVVYGKFKPKKGMRVSQLAVDVEKENILVKGAQTRGRQITTKELKCVNLECKAGETPRWWNKDEMTSSNLFGDCK